MHIKFLAHGQGSARGAVNYLLGERDHNGEERAEVTVLSGDPHLVAEVADASAHQWRYTSGVIAWSPEDNPTPEQINQVVQDFERTAFAGLDPDQYATCAVLHREQDGTAHIHTLTARVELSTGKALNIAPPGHEKTFDPLRDYWNHSQGWARPDDPERFRHVQPGHEPHRSHPDRHPKTRAEITAHIEALAADGLVTNAKEVRQELADIGEITRASKDYVSVRPHGEDKPIRLRGELYRDNWTTDQTLEREARRAQSAAAGRDGQRDPDAAERARKRLEAATGRREAYHRERYQRPEPQLEQAAELSRGWATGADRTDREAPSHGSGTGRALEPGGRTTELDAPGSDHGGRDADRQRPGGERPPANRLADQQAHPAPTDLEHRDPAGRKPAEITPRSGDPGDRWTYLSGGGRQQHRMDGDMGRGGRPEARSQADGVTNDDRARNLALAAVRAAASRIGAAGKRAYRTAERAFQAARALSGATGDVPSRQRGATPRPGTERQTERRDGRQTDRAFRDADRAADRLQDAVTAAAKEYQARLARHEEQQRKRQEAVEALREREERHRKAEPTVKQFTALCRKRALGMTGFRDGSADWRDTPEPLREQIDRYNALPEAAQQRVLGELRDDPAKAANMAGVLKKRGHALDKGRDMGM